MSHSQAVSLQTVSPQVVSLFAEQDSELCIKQGRVWATVGTGGENEEDNYGDHFLTVGQTLRVAKGRNLVFESMNADMPVFFDFLTV